MPTQRSGACGDASSAALCGRLAGSRPLGVRVRTRLLAAGIGICANLGAAALAAGATPRGPEFRVNTTVADSQSVGANGRAIARSGSGNTLVVWQSALQDGSGFGIFAQRYNVNGVAQGGEFRINATTAGDQRTPSVDVDNNNFIVVWAGASAVDVDGIVARVYDPAGVPRGGEIAINGTTAGVQEDPDVAVDNGGDFVTVWSGFGPGDPQGIVARLHRSDGTPLTGDIQVNSDTTGVQSHPSVSANTNGDFVVVWESVSAGGDRDLYFRRFTGSGLPLGPQSPVHAPSTADESRPSVSNASNGNFVVVWDAGTVPGDTDVHVRRFSASGNPLAAEARVNDYTRDIQSDPTVHVTTGGDYVVAWSSDDDSTAAMDWNVRMRQFTRYGTAVGPEQLANSTLAGSQSQPTVALDDIDNFIVLWHGAGSGDADGVFGQLYGLQPNADIGIALTASDATPGEGDLVQLTLTVTNNGPDAATNVSITAPLPAGLTFVSDVATQGNYSPSSGVWSITSMAAPSADVLLLGVRVDAGTAGTTLTPSAALSGILEIDPVPSNDSASVEITPQRHLMRLLASQNPTTLLPGQSPLPVYHLRVVNVSTVAETLLALTCTNTTTGPGTTAQLDASWSDLTLTSAGNTTPLAVAACSGGRVRFDGWSLPLAAQDSVVLTVYGGPTTAARDSDVLDLRLDAATDLEHSGIATMQVMQTLDPPGGFVVDGMSAAQISVHTVPASTFFAGTTHNLSFDITLPANGYSADRLEKLNIFNHGSAVHGTDIAALQAWVDDGDGRFQDVDERLLGSLAFTGNRWELTGISEPVPVQGLRIFFTVDLSATAKLGRTVRLGLSGDPDVPIGMSSGNDGPLDGTVANRYAQSVSTSDRVVMSAVALPARVVRPGSPAVPLLQVVGTNTYETPKTLTEVTVANVSTSANGGSGPQIDATCEQLHLVDDTDNDGLLETTDAVLASAFFTQGRASFGGLAWSVPAGGARSFFVTTDVTLHGAADGDALGAAIGGALDVAFLEPTSIAASWPLDSVGRGEVDGMVAAQLEIAGAAGVSLGPNEGPALALDLRVPPNGYANDVLQGVSVLDVGTARAADLATVRLFRDGGDGVFTPGGGDDVDIAPLVPVDGLWKSPQLAEAIGAGGLRLFVGVRVADAPTDSATVLFSVPRDGIQVASGNDGPVNAPVANTEALLLSTAPLSVSLGLSTTRANVGQDFQVLMTVRNVGTETILAVTPAPLTVTGDGAAILMAPPAPGSADLAADAQVTFAWTYRGTAVGTVQWSGDAAGTGAVGGLVRRSLADRSGSLRLLLRATSMGVEPVGNVPFSINRGETGVVPLSLTFTHDGDARTSDIVLQRLRLRIEDDAGTGIVPAAILAQLVLREGMRTYYTSTTLPSSGDSIDLDLTTPLVISPTEPTTVSFQCDILATTTVPVFRLALTDASACTAADATEGTPVSVHRSAGSFPVQSGIGQVRAAPTRLDVDALPAGPQRCGRGQIQVALLGVRLSNPGVPNVTTNVRVGALQLCLVDSSGRVVAEPGRAFQNLRIKSGAVTLEERSLAADADSLLPFVLSIPALVPAGADNDLYVFGDVAPEARLGTYRLRLGDPAALDARDDNTHAQVPVAYATSPLQGGPLTLEAPAESLRVRGTPQFPPGFTVGETNRTALVVTLRHPGPPGTGRVRIDKLTFQCRDEARRLLASTDYLDRLSVRRGTVEIAQETRFPSAGSFDVMLQDFFLEPGDSVTLTSQVDVEATAPATFFELLLAAFAAVDANLGSSVRVAPEPDAELPLSSGLTKLALPATELAVGLRHRMPAILSADGSETLVATVSLRNTASAGSGSIDVRRLAYRAADRERQAIAVGAAAARVVLRSNGKLVGDSGTLSSDSVTVVFTPRVPLRIDAGTTVLVDIYASFRTDAGTAGFRLGVDAGDIDVIQPASATASVRVQAEPGQSFPLWTEAASFGVLSLRDSFANFPNPFGAIHVHTTFTYYMPLPGRVTLRILTPRGETVTTLLDQAPRAAGLQQSDTWNGLNGHSRQVTNGVYIAALDVQLEDGTHERLLRKVAVVR